MERSYDDETILEIISVLVKKLDDVFSQLEALRYIKIDAEGGEFNILKTVTLVFVRCSAYTYNFR